MIGSWDKKTWRLAGPVILSNMSVPLLGAVDIAVVGHLPGPQFLGAVAVGALIFSLIYHIMNFLRMGNNRIDGPSARRQEFRRGPRLASPCRDPQRRD